MNLEKVFTLFSNHNLNAFSNRVIVDKQGLKNLRLVWIAVLFSLVLSVFVILAFFA
ncbi:hypothetical protein [Mycoplasma parvum]|uniref:Uncharacterized protein n=1 Tax=Mycoplasma parvum str. Indiana TaxID=1403316 RepID=U5NCT1_9MOLU|nr:hypothetical protein [Mycoplasma parvum]AGX89145.1 hypothetical protein PRV_02035 [Mycoplasma parvum str. Indiana]